MSVAWTAFSFIDTVMGNSNMLSNDLHFLLLSPLIPGDVVMLRHIVVLFWVVLILCGNAECCFQITCIWLPAYRQFNFVLFQPGGRLGCKFVLISISGSSNKFQMINWLIRLLGNWHIFVHWHLKVIFESFNPGLEFLVKVIVLVSGQSGCVEWRPYNYRKAWNKHFCDW